MKKGVSNSASRLPPSGGLAAAIMREIRKENWKNSGGASGSVGIKPAAAKAPIKYIPVEAVRGVQSKLLKESHLMDELNAPPPTGTSQELAVRAKILNHLAYLSQSPTRPSLLTSPSHKLQDAAPPSPPRSPKPRAIPPMPFLRTSADLADIRNQIKSHCDSPNSPKLQASKKKQPIGRRPSSSNGRRPGSNQGSSSLLSPPRRVSQSAGGVAPPGPRMGSGASSLLPSRGSSLLPSRGSPTRIAARKLEAAEQGQGQGQGQAKDKEGALVQEWMRAHHREVKKAFEKLALGATGNPAATAAAEADGDEQGQRREHPAASERSIDDEGIELTILRSDDALVGAVDSREA